MRFRLSSGNCLGYWIAGAGRVLVLLHPVGTRARFWQGLGAQLADRYRCLAIDLRGCGESDTPRSRFTLDDLADDVIEMLRSQELRDCVVVGCSMGGMVAQGIALKAPELLAGMVLTGTTYTQTAETRKIPLQRARDCLNGMPLVIDETLRRWFPPAFLAADGPVIKRVRSWLEELDPVVFSWSWEAIAGLDYGERLRQISLPTLLVRGTEDAAGRHMPAMAQLLSRGRFIEMPGAGHMAPMEQPDVLARLLHEFVATEIGP
jgi:3-oxoadipate enol-lactonase